MKSFTQQHKIQNDQYTLKNYQKWKEAGKNDPWQEKSTDRNRQKMTEMTELAKKK